MTQEQKELMLKADALIAKFGNATADLFEQMLLGNWADDQGHGVQMNVAMIRLKGIILEAIDFRAVADGDAACATAIERALAGD